MKRTFTVESRDLSDGSKYWFVKGTDELHRSKGPAVELANGSKYWYKHGVLHRDGGPAVELCDGTKMWYKNGALYSDGLNPAIDFPSGEKQWTEQGKIVDNLPPSFDEMQSKLNEEDKLNKNSNNKEVKKMSNTKPTVTEMIKTDAIDAGYRVAATQASKALKNGIVMMMKSKGADDGKLAAFSSFMDSEIGEIFVSMALGYGLNYAPVISEDARVKRLAKEFRTTGMAMGGNLVVEGAMEYLMPALSGILEKLPAVEDAKTRVSETPQVERKPVHEEESEEEETSLLKHAAGTK